MEHLNLDFENSVNFIKVRGLFFKSFKLSLVVDTELFSYPKDSEGQSDIFWNISSVEDYKDIKFRSYISFSEEVKLTMNEILLWLSSISTNLDSKIYVQIEDSDDILGYFAAWYVDGKTKSIVLEAKEVFKESEFAYCKPIIDMSENLDI
ncbi:hypothetical protein [Psychrobacter sp. DAB_AL62B]|uniref:hypothetical protein n=1 Tax=Psychrobacter sp. DAB_AL62B TaxID=1028420 RepID=UPI00238189AB|nr:hypothetical protein [Psychrobacter sp. DAB_AL62B]MDE4454367.1 hypothetical protein [Psychrobacter sp. DAB_AL62B]